MVFDTVLGGRGKDDAWIITFPENCNFKCIPEEVIAKVLTYLTSVARYSISLHCFLQFGFFFGYLFECNNKKMMF